MIDRNLILQELGARAVVWCGADADAGVLAQVAQYVCQNKIRDLSVSPDAVRTLWPWLENKNVKIMGRFYFPDKRITEEQISDVTVRINAMFKNGGSGAQVFLPYAALGSLVSQTHVIRDDLFFNKDLVVGIDICEIDAENYGELFENLKKINASALLLFMTHDDGNKSDFVGRLYGLLNSWDADFGGGLNFYFGADFMRIEQSWRLVESVRPALLDGVRFFVNI